MERRMKASEFKARCLKLMNEVQETGEEIVITKNGAPVARLVPFRPKPDHVLGCLEGSIKIVGDIIEPIDVEWNAQG